MASYYDKMAKILHNDKIKMPKLVESAVQSDIVAAVSNYMQVDSEKVDIVIETNDKGDILVVATIMGKQLSFRNR